MLLLRGLLRAVIQLLFFGALLFLPIGTWEWPRALHFLAGLTILSLLSTLAMAVWAPASLEARVRRRVAIDQPRADKIASLLMAVSFLAWFILIPNDVFRWQVLPEPSPEVVGAGGVLAVMGWGLMAWAVMENAFATPVVGDQSARSQTLIDTGPYAVIRHPMYLGFFLFLLGAALWLGSYFGALALPVAFLPVVGRILVEEKALRESLDGYWEYTSRVRFRLLPTIW